MRRASGSRLAGTASVAVLALAVLVGLALDSTVRNLPIRARLSDLGRPGGPGAFPFDYGLVLGGLLGLVLVREWWLAAADREDRAVAALAGVTFAALGLAGLFPAPSTGHGPLLVVASLGALGAPLVDGLRLRRAGRSRAGTVLVAGVALVALLWVVRALVAMATFLISGPTSALLLAELATLALFGAWVLFRVYADDLGAADSADAGLTAAGR